jgi:phosphate butyryltransferase
MVRNFDELIEKARKGSFIKTVAVAAAHDEHTLEAVDLAFKNNIVNPILIGDGAKIKELAETHGFSIGGATIVEQTDDKEAAKTAVAMVRSGEADFLMKGKLQTAELLKEVVNRETGLYAGSVMSHIAFLELPNYHKLLVITDGGMIPNPNIDEKTKILLNAVNALRDLGYDNPKAAAMAAAEIVNPKIQESVDAGLLKQMNREGKITGCIVEGPVSYDLMISPESAKIKGYESPVTGDADILLMPNMTCGNILAKALQYSAGAKMAGMIVGAKTPIVLVSRGASAEEKYFSMALSAACAKKSNAG